MIFYYISWQVIHDRFGNKLCMLSLFIYIYMNIEMAHQYILLVTNAYLVARNEMFSKMNVKILI